ncbi:MAG: hypothetical protein Q9167_003630 [Letrouitia subvulpina]
MKGANVFLSLSRTLHDRLRANVHTWKLQTIQSVSRLRGDLFNANEYVSINYVDENLRQPFRVGRVKYAYPLLYQRIVEYLAVSLVNIACYTNPTWTIEFFQKVLPLLQVTDLQYSGLNDLVYKLPNSFKKYQGKDALVLVRRDAAIHASVLSSLQSDPRVKKMSFDELLLYCQAFGLPKTAQTFPLSSEYTSEVIETVRKLQIRWRKVVCPRLQQRQAFLQTLEGQTSERFVRLARECNASIGVSSLLVSEGVQHRLRLHRLQEKLQQLRAAVGKLAEKIDVSAEAPEGESIDKALGSLQFVERDLKGVVSRLGDKALMPAIESPVIGDVWALLEAAEKLLVESGKRLKEVEKAVKGLNKSLK